jgi:DNA-directed RNA polymerase subunit K/omega
MSEQSTSTKSRFLLSCAMAKRAKEILEEDINYLPEEERKNVPILDAMNELNQGIINYELIGNNDEDSKDSDDILDNLYNADTQSVVQKKIKKSTDEIAKKEELERANAPAPVVETKTKAPAKKKVADEAPAKTEDVEKASAVDPENKKDSEEAKTDESPSKTEEAKATAE